ncbi:hypothetical protein DFH07DRAFT_1056471 [Mycena maculata]|uniref:Uncharacterized protein n=1 Tax=Mycena maculata TaxID=230809 RepID=A0AAD7NW83_9AGAR|nr:hypothetical protein DFH07DRAFT_1056471 [Mycena maculata]
MSTNKDIVHDYSTTSLDLPLSPPLGNPSVRGLNVSRGLTPRLWDNPFNTPDHDTVTLPSPSVPDDMGFHTSSLSPRAAPPLPDADENVLDAVPPPPALAPVSATSNDQGENEVEPHDDNDDFLPSPPPKVSRGKRQAPGSSGGRNAKRPKHAHTVPLGHIPILDDPNEEAHYGCYNCIIADRHCEPIAVRRRCRQCVASGDSHCTFTLTPEQLATRLRNLSGYTAASPYSLNEAARNHIAAMAAASDARLLCERATSRLAAPRLSTWTLVPMTSSSAIVARELRGDPIVYSDVPDIVALAALYPDAAPPSHLPDQPVAGPSTLP